MNTFRLSMQGSEDDWWQELKIKQVEVKVFTETDNKDANEPVTFTVKYGPFASEITVGQNETWEDQTDRSFLIDLEPYPPAKASFNLRVRKTPQGSPTGAQWNASFQLTAIVESGGRMPLGGRSQMFKVGDGNPFDFDAILGAKASA